jgi:hypothetical protein
VSLPKKKNYIKRISLRSNSVGVCLRSILVINLILGLSGCVTVREQSCDGTKIRKDTASAWLCEVERVEAQLVDIPLPLKTLLTPRAVSFSDTDATAVMLQYTVKLTVEEICLFYQQEMERLGWQQQLFFTGQESVLVFDRLRRSCVVSVKGGAQTALMIVVGAKTKYK